MSELLGHRPAFYVIGLLIGLVAVGLVAVLNQRVSALRGYSDLVERLSGRTPRLGWTSFFLLGILGGSLLFRLLAGSPTVHDGYGWLTRTFGDDDYLTVGGLLLAGGVLIGFGAKLAGGCTSGNGIGGCSAGSPASLAATATFMATAIAASFVIRAVA